MRGGKALCNLQSVLECPPLGNRPFGQPLAQRLPREQLHRRVGDAGVVAEIVDAKDVGVGERGDRLRLSLESSERLRIGRELFRQDLDRDLPFQPGVSRSVHLSHAARTDRRDDLVGPEASPGYERQDAGILFPRVRAMVAGPSPRDQS